MLAMRSQSRLQPRQSIPTSVVVTVSRWNHLLLGFHEHFCHTIWLTSVQEVTPERVRWALALGNYGIVAHHWTGLR